MRWSIFICGAGLLCLAAWIDNLRGPLLPAITELMELDYAAASLIVALGNLVAMISTWLLMPLLNKHSLRQIGGIVLMYTTLVCLSAFFADSKIRIFLWGAMVGGCLSTMGSLSNLYVQAGTEDGRRGQMMSALHSIYGLSSFFAPWLAGLVLADTSRWPYLFAAAAPFAAALAIYIQFFLKGPIERTSDHDRAQPLSLEPIHILSVITLICYVVAETLTSTWLPSYLVREHNISLREASIYTSAFFAVMFVTRISCGLWATPRWHRALICASMISALICFVCGKWLGLIWLLPAAGLFGPFFPLFVTWTSLRFPQRDRTVLLWTLSGMQAALALMNYVTGRIADTEGFEFAFWLPAIMMVVTLLLLKWLEIKDHALIEKA